MPQSHLPYSPEYRRRIVEIGACRAQHQRVGALVRPSANAIRKWVKQAGLDEGLRSDGLTTSERDELNRLRRENRVAARRARDTGKSRGLVRSASGPAAIDMLLPPLRCHFRQLGDRFLAHSKSASRFSSPTFRETVGALKRLDRMRWCDSLAFNPIGPSATTLVVS